MQFSQNPLLWKNLALFSRDGKPDLVAFGTFQRDLADLCYAFQQKLSTASQLASVLSAHSSLGTVSTNQTFAANGCPFLNLLLTITASLTLTITGLSAGTAVTITVFNSTGGSLSFKLAATNLSGAAYATIQAMTTADVVVDLLGTGVSIGAGGQRTLTGGTVDTNRLQTVML